MTNLPNNFERYTSALRILTSLFILKNGLNIKYLKNLSKIYTAESYFYKNQKQPLDIENFCYSIFYAVSIIKFKHFQNFDFKIHSQGNFLINKKLFTVFLLNLCLDCNEILVTTNQSHIEINFKGKYKKSLKALEKLKGFYFYSLNQNYGKIVIPAVKTDRTSESFESEWENIFNRFSAVNIFFENLL